ncbi:MAG TPA: LysM peptidoglycan-binding domain-containing protein, partial [Anseongella sp.]|nr:LysM peptidoglycan-binding domain-containing protein [Anseongella sp.]
GEIEKMLIKAYTYSTCSTPVAEPYTFRVNPSSYNYKYQLEMAEDENAGASGTPLKYFRQVPNTWNFEILIDGTGAIKNAGVLDISLIGNSSPLNVDEEVKKLKALVLDYNGEIHRNPYLVITWGEEVFKGTLESLDLEYKLFKPEGTPLRVIAKLSLKEWVDPEHRILIEDPSSPDITHQRTFTGSDRLDLMVHKIYDTPRYYIDVAGANGLNSFRSIQPGKTLNLPPVK